MFSKLFATATLTLLLGGCAKNELVADKLPEVSKGLFPPFSNTFFPRIFKLCIDSLSHLEAEIGVAAEYPVAGVVLENGDEIEVGGHIKKISYSTDPMMNEYSAFRSRLYVEYDTYGITETYYVDVWSLGCFFTFSAQGPFTNLVKGRHILMINTCFVWAIPPYQINSPRVRYVVLR